MNFKNIRFIEKKGGLPRPIHTIGWKFKFKRNEYGNFISDQVPTGETYTYWDDDEECEKVQQICKTVPLIPQDEITLLENMIEMMQHLVDKKK